MASAKRIESLDLIKLIGALFVVMHHCMFISVVPLAGGLTFGKALVFCYNTIVNTLPVPLFIVISLWLYVSRRADQPGYFKKRLLRLVQILLIWSVIYALVGTVTGAYATFPHTLLGYVLIPLVDGGLYYLASLIVCTCLVEGLARLRGRSVLLFRVVAVVSLIAAVAMQAFWVPLFRGTPVEVQKLYGLGPLMFLFYAPALVLLHDAYRGVRRSLRVGVLLAFLYALNIGLYSLATRKLDLLAALYWLGYQTPLTLALAFLVLLIALKSRLTLPAWIRSVASYGLGIYLIHPLIIGLLRRFIPSAQARLPHLMFIWSGMRLAVNGVFLLVIVALTAVVLFVLSRTRFKFLIR